jgi:prepilin-type N-terminal cleavage/methylation domain-containing protein
MMTTNPQPQRMSVRRAFTLVEILVVLATISIVVALGVPLFNTLTGARSVEAGRNLVAAALGQARTVAVNEGAYAGVLFYIDPATERTAMSIVIVSDPKSGLDDPDPYDKYKTWISGQEYKAPGVDAAGVPVRGDRVIGFAADADSVYRGALYATNNGTGAISNPLASEYLRYFGNYRPTVRSFRAQVTDTATNTAGNRPPRNGPYGYPGAVTTPDVFLWDSGNLTRGSKPPAESSTSQFGNDNWGDASDAIVTTYSVGGQQLLPTGIGVQLIIQPIIRNAPGANVATTPPAPFQERYVRTGVVLFDPQGRLSSLRNVVIEENNALGNTLALNGNAQAILAGVGVAIYDGGAFRDAVLGDTGLRATQSDYIYQAVVGGGNIHYIDSLYDNFFADQDNTNNATQEYNEELWLDNNTTPLLINRYSGSLSATD